MSLHYDFPRKHDGQVMSRDAQISRNLDFPDVQNSPVSHISKEPYVKSFLCSNPNTPESLIISSIDDPIDDIFQESHRQISSYQMQMPGMSPIASPRKAIDTKNNEVNASHKESGRSFDESLLDPLACHADNIMRMAMDSTLAHSFSSNFSNLVDDTHLEKSRRFTGFNERSIVEISAADLESAVNDPFKL